MKTATIKAVKTVLAINGISIHKIAGEFKVYPKNTIGQAYFTDDIMDALGTGLEMARTAGTLVGPDGRRIETKSKDAVVTASKQTAVACASSKVGLAAYVNASKNITPTLAAAVEYHNVAVVKPSDKMEFDGGAKVKAAGRIFKVKANAYGNWYGYQGSTRVTMFFGDYVDQMFEAATWLNTLSQAAALATL